MSKTKEKKATTDAQSQGPSQDRQTRLYELGMKWRDGLLAIGRELCEAQAAKEPVGLYIREVLCHRVGMPQATARVAMRWAAGEYGDEDDARLLVSVVPHSFLAGWAVETVTHVLRATHTIASPISGRVEKKRIRDMDPREVSANVGPQGFRPIESPIERPPEFRYFAGRRVFVDEHGELFIESGGAQPVRVRVTRKLLDEAMELAGQTA